MQITGRNFRFPQGVMYYSHEQRCYVIRVDDQKDPSQWLEIGITQLELDNAKNGEFGISAVPTDDSITVADTQGLINRQVPREDQ